jgi:PPE-repeat protein
MIGANALFAVALSAISGVGKKTIDNLRTLVENEVANLDNPNTVGSITVDEAQNVKVVLNPSTTPYEVVLTPGKLGGLAKTQRILDLFGSLVPAPAKSFSNQLLRVLTEVTILVVRKSTKAPIVPVAPVAPAAPAAPVEPANPSA